MPDMGSGPSGLHATLRDPPICQPGHEGFDTMTDVSSDMMDPDEPLEAARLFDCGLSGMPDQIAGPPEIELDDYPTPEPIISVEHVEHRNLELDLIRASWGLLRELPLPERIAIVATGDLRGSCEDREMELYRTWSSFRTSGRVTSKAVVTADGQQFILLDARLVLREQFDSGAQRALPEALAHTECSLERLLEHEGLHLVIRAHGEGADVTFCECQLDGDRAFDQFRMMASLALEEFRVEREQCEADRFLDKNTSATLPLEMQRYRDVFVQGFAQGGGVAASRALNDLAMEIAAVVAAHMSGDALDQLLFAETRWQQIVGPTWDMLVRELEGVPGALTRMTGVDLGVAIDGLARCLSEWFVRLGFTLEDAPDGGGLLFSADPASSSLDL
jgi:hypothetical protein